MFRLLYTLLQALSHCRLSHFIPIYFRTFAFYTSPSFRVIPDVCDRRQTSYKSIA